MAFIRPFHEKDSAAVVSLWERSGISRPWLDLRAEIVEKVRRDPELFLVGELDGAIVSVAMGAYDGRRGWVYHLAVEPRLQRQRLGAEMMTAVEAAMRDAGVDKINIQIRGDNAAVQGFYETLGYRDEHLVSMGKWLR